ncbi:protein of unknown function [Pararobbsia alpina]
MSFFITSFPAQYGRPSGLWTANGLNRRHEMAHQTGRAKFYEDGSDILASAGPARTAGVRTRRAGPLPSLNLFNSGFLAC